MKQNILLTMCLIFSTSIFAQTFPVSSIFNNGADNKRVNFVLLGDGYTSSQQTDFINDATNITNDLFNESPFKEYKNFFNTYAIEVPSQQSGASHPGTATDVSEPVIPITNVTNRFGSSFDAFNIHRLLVPSNSSEILTVLGNNFPSYDQVLMVVNSDEYGGSGGVWATSSTHSSAGQIAIHEIGHSFAGLADEYWAGDVYAAEKPNMTQTTDPNTVKWADWMNIGNVGIYQHGTTGLQASWYRPHQNCKMRFLSSPFCGVCSESIIDKIYSLVTPIDDFTPANANLTFTGTPIDFNLSLVLPSPNTISVDWQLNGSSVGSNASVTLGANDFSQSNNTLTAIVTDNTTLSKSYLPASGYVFTKTWTISNNTSSIGEVVLDDKIGKFYYKAFPNPTKDKLNIHYSYNGKNTDVNISILAVDGKMVKQISSNLENGEGDILLDISELTSGNYIVHLKNEKLKVSFKIVVTE